MRVRDPETAATAMRDHLVQTRRLLLAADPSEPAVGEDPPWAAR
jgi:DNA-binding GntR family transcriptional regulator